MASDISLAVGGGTRRMTYAELADARTAAMITVCEAAALRTRLELLTDVRRRPWWRWWFR